MTMYSSYDVDRFGIIRSVLGNEIGVTERVGQTNSADRTGFADDLVCG
jgi:hypothetical protein